MIGEDKFFQGCKSYFQKHAWKNTTLKDFMNNMQDEVKESPVDLDLFTN